MIDGWIFSRYSCTGHTRGGRSMCTAYHAMYHAIHHNHESTTTHHIQNRARPYRHSLNVDHLSICPSLGPSAISRTRTPSAHLMPRASAVTAAAPRVCSHAPAVQPARSLRGAPHIVCSAFSMSRTCFELTPSSTPAMLTCWLAMPGAISWSGLQHSRRMAWGVSQRA